MAKLVVKRYQSALEFLAKAPFPVVATLDGQTALGGGSSCSCGVRPCFCNAEVPMGLPEVNVGLFPPEAARRLCAIVVGFKNAVEMITTARVSPAEVYAESGVVTLCKSEELEAGSRAWLLEHQGIVNRNYDPDYQDRTPFRTTKSSAYSTRRGSAIPSARSGQSTFLQRSIALEAGLKLSFDEAVASEVELFVPHLFHPNSRNKIDLFFLSPAWDRGSPRQILPRQ